MGSNSVYQVRRYAVLTPDMITSAVTEYADPKPPEEGGEKPAASRPYTPAGTPSHTTGLNTGPAGAGPARGGQEGREPPAPTEIGFPAGFFTPGMSPVWREPLMDYILSDRLLIVV